MLSHPPETAEFLNILLYLFWFGFPDETAKSATEGLHLPEMFEQKIEYIASYYSVQLSWQLTLSFFYKMQSSHRHVSKMIIHLIV